MGASLIDPGCGGISTGHPGWWGLTPPGGGSALDPNCTRSFPRHRGAGVSSSWGGVPPDTQAPGVLLLPGDRGVPSTPAAVGAPPNTRVQGVSPLPGGGNALDHGCGGCSLHHRVWGLPFPGCEFLNTRVWGSCFSLRRCALDPGVVETPLTPGFRVCCTSQGDGECPRPGCGQCSPWHPGWRCLAPRSWGSALHPGCSGTSLRHPVPVVSPLPGVMPSTPGGVEAPQDTWAPCVLSFPSERLPSTLGEV